MNNQVHSLLRRVSIFSRRLISGTLGGDYISAFKGAGMEFHQLREYAPGDDVRAIDWHSSLKTDKLMVKQFIQERDRDVLLLIDCSASGIFSSSVQSRMHSITEVAATIASIAYFSSDRVGAVFFTDTVEHYIAPARGGAHIAHIIEALTTFRPYSTKTKIASALEFLLNLKKRNIIVFMLSDWIDGAQKEFTPLLRVASKRHDLIAVRFLDRTEHDFPSFGMLEVEDIETGTMQAISTLVRGNNKLNSFLHKRIALQDQLMQSCNVDALDIILGNDCMAPLMKFFHKRKCRRI